MRDHVAATETNGQEFLQEPYREKSSRIDAPKRVTLPAGIATGAEVLSSCLRKPSCHSPSSAHAHCLQGTPPPLVPKHRIPFIVGCEKVERRARMHHNNFVLKNRAMVNKYGSVATRLHTLVEKGSYVQDL
jgi:hypothetical protein